MMLLVLCRVCELKRATSREVADSVGLGGVKYVSLVLSRCKRRGYVDREPYGCGREHGYVYWLTDKGAEWLLKKADSKKETSGVNTPKVLSKDEVKSKSEDVAPVTSPVLMSSSDMETLTVSNSGFRSLQLENEVLNRENQELSLSVGLALKVIRECSWERDFYGWKYYSLNSQLERKNEELQLLVGLLKSKDEIIFGLLQYILESERRSKLPESGFSLKRKPQVEFKLPPIKKLDVQQLQKARARETSILDDIIKWVAEELALRFRLAEIDQWSNWLPSPLGGGYKWDIFWDVTKAYYDELKGAKKSRKISKSYGRRCEVPKEILRLPY